MISLDPSGNCGLERTMRARVQGRLVVFLDMNVWIDLAESEDPGIVSFRAFAERLADDGQAVFPLADFTIRELFKQCFDSALRVAALMDRLSKGVSFSTRTAIQRLEALNYINRLSVSLPSALGLGDVFAPVGAHFVGGSLTEESPGKNVPWSCSQDALGVLHDRRRGFELTLCDCVRHQAQFLPMPEDVTVAEEWERVIKARMEFAGRSWEKHRRVEEEFVMRERVLTLFSEYFSALKGLQGAEPSLTAILASGALELYRKVQSLRKDRYGGLAEDIRRSAPAIQAEVDVHAATGRDPGRRHRASDFYDIEMMIVPRVYSHVLVARDKWVRSHMAGALRRDDLIYVSDLADAQRAINAALKQCEERAKVRSQA